MGACAIAGNYISTSHERSTEFGGPDLTYELRVANGTLRSYDHSHPGNSEPSGFSEQYVGRDKKFAEWVNKYFPGGNVKLSVYQPGNKKYVQYDHNEIKPQ